MVGSVKEFSERIKRNRVLAGTDVATYILTRIKCTHLSLERLIYLSYAKYMSDTGKKLFEDEIYAFRHGPVVQSVHDRYKKSGSEFLDTPKLNTTKRTDSSSMEMAARSRILFAYDGIGKFRAVNHIIEKYGKYSASDLVSLTHRKGSPWDHSDSTKPFERISDELILAYHYIENEN